MNRYHVYYGDIFPWKLWSDSEETEVITSNISSKIRVLSKGWFTYLIDMDAIFDGEVFIPRYSGGRSLGVEFGNVMRRACDDGLTSIIHACPKTFSAFTPDEGFLFSRRDLDNLVKMSSPMHIDNLLRRGFPIPAGYENIQRFYNEWKENL